MGSDRVGLLQVDAGRIQKPLVNHASMCKCGGGSEMAASSSALLTAQGGAHASLFASGCSVCRNITDVMQCG